MKKTSTVLLIVAAFVLGAVLASAVGAAYAAKPPTGGLSGFEVVWASGIYIDTTTVQCPTGKIAIGGGFRAAEFAWPFLNAPVGSDIIDTPNGSGTNPTGWQVAFRNIGGTTPPTIHTVYVICVNR